MGDTVTVKVIEIEDGGKVKLDRLDKPKAPEGSGHGSGEAVRAARAATAASARAVVPVTTAAAAPRAVTMRANPFGERAANAEPRPLDNL